MSFSRSTSSGSKSSFLSYKELIEKDLQPGDLIEVDRGAYNHWAMYTDKCENGTHWCFHVTTSDGDFEKKEALMSRTNGSNAVAAIKKHKLKDILEDNDSKKPSMARINNKTNEANKKKCVPRPIFPVIEHLEKRKDETIKYDLRILNCEHYVTTWKYGAGWSRQVEMAEMATFSAVAVATIGSIIGVGLLIAGIFKMFSSSSKYEEDDSDSD